MLLGGNLGFSWLLLVFLFVPVVIGFVVRRKWRLAVARREEIKRLLVLASEEAARAELEASNGYVTVAAAAAIPRQLPYQCAVCFSPTTTRCARCKAVRYCSGKCQIVHWRQGHKEECRPFITTNQNNDVGGEFVQKENNRKEYETYGYNYEPEERQCAEPVEKFPEGPFSNPSSSRHVLGRKSDTEIESPADTFTSSAKLNHIKIDCSDGDTHCESTSSSGWTVDGSTETSLSEPSTPSSGFWEGTIDSSRSKNDGLDDAQSSVHFSCNFAKDAVPPLHEQGPDAKTVISDGALPTNVGIKKPNSGAILSEEIRRDASKERNSPSSNSQMSYHMHSESSGESHVLKNRDNKSFSGSVFSAHPAFSTERRSRRTEASDNEPISSKVQKVHLSSRPPDAHLSSSTVLHAVSSVKSGKGDSALKTSVMKVVDRLRPSELSRHYPLGVGSGVTGRYNNKGLFSYELFVKLYNSKKIELRPCGLTNCGNSCYANAVLQCLAFTPPLTAYLLEGLHSKACKKKEWCFTCEFESLVLKAEEGSSPLSPIGILSQLQNIGSHLGGGREEDAHEFLRYAIDTMQSVCLNETGATASSSMEEETTLIGLTFGGYLRSKIKCTKCGGKSERHEKIMDLTVEIDGDIETLEEALRKFTGTEILDGQNKYHCGRCKSYEKAKKRLTVLEAPNVLTIALKRFQSGKFGKLNKTVRFPEILDLAPCMSGTSDKSPIYSLYGVVVHLDVMNASFSGHYVCYIKNIQNKWFKIDDSMVKPVEIESVLTKGAYMLLYARCSPRAPRLIRNPMIPCDPRTSKNPPFKSRPHTPVPRDVSGPGQTNSKPIYTNHPSPRRTHFEEDSLSDNSSSPCFSEESSSSTDSTRGSSTSADEFLDQIFGDLGHNWNNRWRNSSDSDTSSSSSSPSPSYSSSDWHSSSYTETGGSHIDNPESAVEGHDLRARLSGRSGICEMENLEGKGSVPFSCSDTTEQCRKVDLSSSCREINSNRLGRVNPFDFKSGVSFSRSMRDRTT